MRNKAQHERAGYILDYFNKGCTPSNWQYLKSKGYKDKVKQKNSQLLYAVLLQSQFLDYSSKYYRVYNFIEYSLYKILRSYYLDFATVIYKYNFNIKYSLLIINNGKQQRVSKETIKPLYLILLSTANLYLYLRNRAFYISIQPI